MAKTLFKATSGLTLIVAIFMSLAFGHELSQIAMTLPPWACLVLVLAVYTAASPTGAFWAIAAVALAAYVGLWNPVAGFSVFLAKGCLYLAPVLLWLGVNAVVNRK